MSFLSRLFGSGSDRKSSGDVEAKLERLEREAEKAAPGYVGTAFNRAGDLALREGLPERAVGYYGQAIDAFLEDAQREAARGVANKIIRVRPTAVRTLCTLTWLDLAAQHQATALLHLRDYVEAAKKAGEHARAATQVYEMAKICPLGEFVGAVADSLDHLDYPRRANEVRAWATHGAPDMIEDDDALAEACLRAAVHSNDRNGELTEEGAPRLPEEEVGQDEGAAAAEREDEESVEAGDEERAAPVQGEEDEGVAVEGDELASGDVAARASEDRPEASSKKVGCKERKKPKRGRYRWE